MMLALALAVGCSTYDPFADAFEVSDADNDGFPDSEDCAPGDVLTNPDSVEICDGLDNDCDGEVDEDPVVGDTWYLDEDLDNYGDYDAAVVACSRPPGHSTQPGDCDDSDETSYPGADEVCDGADNDCDGNTDEAASDAALWYYDSDGDGFGTPYDTHVACEDAMPSGYVADGDDCNDQRDDVNPAAQEVCDDTGTDEDCDGRANDSDSDVQGQQVSYYDGDGDGYGDDDYPIWSCDDPIWPVEGGDCDSTDASIHPGAFDIAGDLIDHDCDGLDD